MGECRPAPTPGEGKRDLRRSQGRGAVRTAEDKAGIRTVPIPSVVADELAKHTGPNPDPKALVFTGGKGAPLRAGAFRQRVSYPATKAAGFDGLRLHDLRHTAVALWIAAGANPKEIAVRAGHSSVVTVLDRYGHLYPEAEDRLSGALGQQANRPTGQQANRRPHDHKAAARRFIVPRDRNRVHQL